MQLPLFSGRAPRPGASRASWPRRPLHEWPTVKSASELRRTKNYAKFLGHPDVIPAGYVTVTLDNNWDNKHVVSGCCYFLKMCCSRSRLVFNRCFYDIDISQGSVATQLRCGGMFTNSIITVLLQIFSPFWQWNNLENRLIFGKVKACKIVPLLGHPVHCKLTIHPSKLPRNFSD